MRKKLPQIIEEVGFNFNWSEKKVWALDLPVEEIDITELEWHFNIPFWDKPNGFYDLSPNEVLNNKEKYSNEYQRILKADLSYPLDIMFWKNRWVLLDGLHRLLKAKILGQKKIQVRKIPKEAIPQIVK